MALGVVRQHRPMPAGAEENMTLLEGATRQEAGPLGIFPLES
jgi:hypothetical protein